MDLPARFNLMVEIKAFEFLIECCKFVPLLGGKMSFADFLESLTAFEAGGSELAFAPIDSFKEMPADASISGGQNAAIAWFRRSLEISEQAMLFLVGAPGNGKSYLLRKVTEGLVPVGDHQKDRRRFEFENESKTGLIVINDASAPSESGESAGQLVSDLRDAFSSRRLLHANVNRGVLYQELRSNFDESPIRELLEWLSDTSREQNANWNSLKIDVPNGQSNIRCGKLRVEESGSETEIPIVIVLMDFYSIFERQPMHEIQTKGDWSGFPKLAEGELYRVQMPRSMQRRSRDDWRLTPAGQLLEKVIDQGNVLLDPDFEPLNSISSNLVSLKQDSFFCGILSSLRNAELITSQHISFRELWTAIATVIIGNGESRQSIEGLTEFRLKPFDWISQCLQKLDNCDEPEERIKLIIQIAATRLSQSMYGSLQSPFDPRSDKGFSPLLSLTRRADPVIDACPDSVMNGQQFGWVTPVVDSLRAQIGDVSIIETLKRNAQFIGIEFEFAPFDLSLDKEIVQLIAADYADEPVISKEMLESVLIWYGDYLSRLFAVSLGVTAFENEIYDWVSVWNKAVTQQPIPRQVSKAILSILLPKFRKLDQSEGDQRLVSFLTSRTESITVKSIHPRLAIEISAAPNFRAKAIGDEISIEIRDESGIVLILFNLDFDFLREALAFLDWPQAFTENSISLTPKIERMRASMVGQRMIEGSVRLIDGMNIEDVQVR